MLISIVTGTYNRLPLLKAMIASVRQQIPRHLPYEFCITDCGSTDGTVEWLREQQDVCLLEQHERRGAIKQFGDAARMAQGDYVVMANDDITFHPFSILRAAAYLEDHPECGAVGFADNRSAKLGHAPTNRVEQMSAIDPGGRPIAVNYGQVCMVRRWLGEAVGWWGDQDDMMSRAFTYGGDNFMSARIWEMGYSVDAVPGCLADDVIARDATREESRSHGQEDGRWFRRRFPQGPHLPGRLLIPNPQGERLRILVADIHEPKLPAARAREQGLAEAFAQIGLTWHVDYVNEDTDLAAAAESWQPHLIFTQMHDPSRINALLLSKMRAACPEAVIVNWNGDAHEKGLISPAILEALRYVDLQTVVNAKVLPVYEREGIHAAYWQIAYKDPAEPFEGEVPSHDVLFLGNCYNEDRRALARALNQLRPGLDVGLYGRCEESAGNTHYDFARSRALYEHCTIAIGDTFAGSEAFVSNRMLQALAAGAFLLQQHSDRLDEFNGWQAGVHYVEWTDLADLKRKIREWIKPGRAAKRKAIAEAGRVFVREHFSYCAQVEKLWRLL